MNLIEQKAFYSLRDRRSVEYIGKNLSKNFSVHISISEAAVNTLTGQHILLSLTNMLARVHGNINFNIPHDVQLLINHFLNGSTLGSTVIKTAYAIDPYGNYSIGNPSGQPDISLGIGNIQNKICDFYLGADHWKAYIQNHPAPINDKLHTYIGASLSACLGATYAFKKMLGIDNYPKIISLWNFQEEDDAALGPEELPLLDIGNVLIAGAGAVTSSLAYWLYPLNITGSWSVVDDDIAKLHNTNRGMLFLPEHTDWLRYPPLKKAEIIANYLTGSTPLMEWYDESEAAQKLDFDVILALANERNVRTLLARRNAPVTLHATTSRTWLSQLHRHIPAIDDCIACRMNDIIEPDFECSTVKIPGNEQLSGIITGEETDAALPFLSATSGLMLASALYKLQFGEIILDAKNDWRFDLLSNNRIVSAGKRKCKEGCNIILPEEMRHDINKKNRWNHIDKK